MTQNSDDRYGRCVAVVAIVLVGFASFMTGRGFLTGATRYRNRAVALDPDHAKRYLTERQSVSREQSARETVDRTLASLEERVKALDARVVALEAGAHPIRQSVDGKAAALASNALVAGVSSSSATSSNLGGAVRAVANEIATDVLTVFPASSDEGAVALGEVHIHERPLQL